MVDGEFRECFFRNGSDDSKAPPEVLPEIDCSFSSLPELPSAGRFARREEGVPLWWEKLVDRACCKLRPESCPPCACWWCWFPAAPSQGLVSGDISISSSGPVSVIVDTLESVLEGGALVSPKTGLVG